MIEIEKKFQVLNFDHLRKELAAGSLDVMETREPVLQSDEYFNHRQLRFELKDIALRIRQTGDTHVLTFKGPNQDATTKIRQELEVGLDEQNALRMAEIFLGLGMHSVAKVRKTREVFKVRWQEETVEICMDAVEEVGYFVELEVVAKNEEEIEPTKQKLEALANLLDLSESTTTSYLEMLLAGRAEQ